MGRIFKRVLGIQAQKSTRICVNQFVSFHSFHPRIVNLDIVVPDLTTENVIFDGENVIFDGEQVVA